MDPVTAAILIGLVASTAVGLFQANAAQEAEADAQEQQRQMRMDQTRAEMAATEQRSSIAMGTASKRPTNKMTPSFAAAAMTGNQSSNSAQAPSGSAGTF